MDSLERKMSTSLEDKAISKNSKPSPSKTKTKKEQKAKDPKDKQHNSLQHDPTITMPLLSALVEALKKDNKEESEEDKDSLETITSEIEEIESDESTKKKDAVAALADRIKSLYANEMTHNAYAQAGQSSYNPMSAYNDSTATSNGPLKALQSAYEDGSYFGETDDKKPKAITDENSNGYKLSKGSKMQAYIMTDPKGRLHNTWNVVRVVNESYDGKIERNDGLHGQWL